MIITKEMLDTVRPYANFKESYRLLFPNESKALGYALKLKEVAIEYNNIPVGYGDGRDNAVYISTDKILVTAYLLKAQTFFTSAQVRANDAQTLTVLAQAGAHALRIDSYADEIKKIIIDLLPQIEKFRADQQVLSSADWSFDRVEKLFNVVAVDGAFDSEKALKKLWNNSAWQEVISGRGKHEAFEIIRRVITSFYETYQKIVNQTT